jgi:diacylglycerol kinase (ATP)
VRETVRALARAFRNSRAGLIHACRTERAIRQELILLALALPAAAWIGTGVWDRVALVATLLLMLTVELLNTCVEKLCDHVTPQIHPQVKAVKDMGSAAVLCAICLAGLVWGAALLIRLGIL